jgi:hypothetical protein
VVATAARRTAIKEVKRQMQAQGAKVGLVPYREIALQAEQYLAQHRAELIAETHAMVLAPPPRALYEREQRKRHRLAERNLANSHNRQKPDLQGVSLCRCHEQNGERK